MLAAHAHQDVTRAWGHSHHSLTQAGTKETQTHRLRDTTDRPRRETESEVRPDDKLPPAPFLALSALSFESNPG